MWHFQKLLPPSPENQVTGRFDDLLRIIQQLTVNADGGPPLQQAKQNASDPYFHCHVRLGPEIGSENVVWQQSVIKFSACVSILNSRDLCGPSIRDRPSVRKQSTINFQISVWICVKHGLRNFDGICFFVVVSYLKTFIGRKKKKKKAENKSKDRTSKSIKQFRKQKSESRQQRAETIMQITEGRWQKAKGRFRRWNTEA